MSKRGILVILIATTLFLALILFGCNKPTCQKDQILLNKECCYDRNYNFVCDETEDVAICNDGKCNADENCSTCWQDCGVCPVIRKVYVPVNFSLDKVKESFNPYFDGKLLLRKDLDFRSNSTDYYYHEKRTPKYQADFLDVKYNPLITDKILIVSKIKLPEWYVNDSLIRWVNHSHYYLVKRPLELEKNKYEQRYARNTAKDAYPTTGNSHDTIYRYKDWVASNYSKKETIWFDNTTVLDNSMVWSVFASVTDYTVDYITGQFKSEYDEDEIQVKINQHKFIDEKRINYINTITFVCARNMPVTLIDPGFSVDNRKISKDNVAAEIKSDRENLLKKAVELKTLCNKEFSNGILV